MNDSQYYKTLIKSVAWQHLLLLTGLLLSAAAFADKPIVIVLSWDGLRHDYPDLADFSGLRRLEQ